VEVERLSHGEDGGVLSLGISITESSILLILPELLPDDEYRQEQGRGQTQEIKQN
jgi:hypothetical protein